MSKSGPTRYRVPAALFLHHVQGHDPPILVRLLEPRQINGLEEARRSGVWKSRPQAKGTRLEPFGTVRTFKFGRLQ